MPLTERLLPVEFVGWCRPTVLIACSTFSRCPALPRSMRPLQVQSSPQLQLLLHTVLQLGNTLNAGRRPPSSGIRLSSLRKLADTRSFDGSTTLAHYLAALLSQSAPEVRCWVGAGMGQAARGWEGKGREGNGSTWLE